MQITDSHARQSETSAKQVRQMSSVSLVVHFQSTGYWNTIFFYIRKQVIDLFASSHRYINQSLPKQAANEQNETYMQLNWPAKTNERVPNQVPLHCWLIDPHFRLTLRQKTKKVQKELKDKFKLALLTGCC